MQNAGLDESQAVFKIARRNINNLRYIEDTTLMDESEKELKSLLMRVKGESEKAGLKLNIQEMKIMASSPISSVQLFSHVRLFATPWTAAHQDSHQQLLEPVQTHVHRIGDAINPFHPLLSPFPLAFNLG